MRPDRCASRLRADGSASSLSCTYRCGQGPRCSEPPRQERAVSAAPQIPATIVRRCGGCAGEPLAPVPLPPATRTCDALSAADVKRAAARKPRRGCSRAAGARATHMPCQAPSTSSEAFSGRTDDPESGTRIPAHEAGCEMVNMDMIPPKKGRGLGPGLPVGARQSGQHPTSSISRVHSLKILRPWGARVRCAGAAPCSAGRHPTRFRISKPDQARPRGGDQSGIFAIIKLATA